MSPTPPVPAPAGTDADPRDQKDLEDLIRHARERVESGDLEGGLQALKDLALRFPDFPELHNDLGALCTSLQRYEEAAEAFARVVELRPEAANGHFNLGMIHFRLQRYLEAASCFESAAAHAPEDPEVHNNLGVSRFQLQDWEPAREAFEEALRLRPSYLSAQLNLADVDLAQGRCEEAWQRCRPLAEASDDPALWGKICEIARRRAEQGLEQAASAHEEALRRLPSQEALREGFGRVIRARETLMGEAAGTAR